MRTLALVVILAAASQLLGAQQLRREPLIVAVPFGVLSPPGSPIELAEGAIEITSQGRWQQVRVRSKEPMLPLTGVIIRIAAGLFENGMITYRLQMADVKHPAGFVDPTGWMMRLFQAIPGDALPDFSRVGRHTRFLMTVEQITDISGKVVFDNSDAREQLWRALGGDRK
jgi:hypothetical protein